MEYIVAKEENIDLVMKSRLEMLKVVNELPQNYVFDNQLITLSRKYFENADQTTVLALDSDVIGCATMCYVDMMPTYSHPSGKRAHLMNVYTNNKYRKKGIAFKMVSMLIEVAKERGVTEISLDATELGRPLYEKLGFVQSDERMVLTF